MTSLIGNITQGDSIEYPVYKIGHTISFHLIPGSSLTSVSINKLETYIKQLSNVINKEHEKDKKHVPYLKQLHHILYTFYYKDINNCPDLLN